MKNQRIVVIGGLFTLVGIATFLRFYQIDKLSFWTDEIWTMIYATSNLKDVFWRDPNMILYYLLIRYWSQIFPGASGGMLRALSGIFSVASIPVVFLLGRTMRVSRVQATTVGLIAALLVTINAYHIQYGQELRAYSLVFLLATLSTFLLIKAIEEPSSPNHWWIWYTIVSVAAIYSHFFALFVLIAQAASLLVLLLGNAHAFPFKGGLTSGIAMAILIAPVVIVVYKIQAIKGISWISELTFSDIREFALYLTGKEGEPLLILYLLAGSIGLLTGVRAWLGKNLIEKWKFTLMANCLFLPVVSVLVLSKVITPMFMPHYLLLVMPYLTVLTGVGIVTLASLKWKSLKLWVITLPAGLAILVLIVALSAAGVKSYYEDFRKEDFRGAAQFLTGECSEGLRLYQVPWMEPNITYYNASLKSQVEIWEWNDEQWGWNLELSQNPSPEELAEFLPDDYHRACLVLGHINTTEQVQQTMVIQAALRIDLPKVTTMNFSGFDVEVYETSIPETTPTPTPTPEPASTSTPTAVPVVKVVNPRQGPEDYQAGVAVVVYGNDREFELKTQKLLNHLASLEVNSLGLCFPLYQDDWTSSTIRVDEERTPSEERIRLFIHEAHNRGFTIMLRPILNEQSLMPGHWRGSIQPQDKEAWFQSYTNIILGYAKLAEEEGVEILSLGTELSSLEKEANWLFLIEKVRAVYHGQLTYSSNWRGSYVGFWDRLDFISVDAFFKLDVPQQATVEQLVAAWQPWISQMEQARILFNKPIVLTELGTMSQVGSYQEPWRWEHNTPVDLEAQRLYYTSSCQASLSLVSGIYWWSVSLDLPDNPAEDPGFNPLGKPAESEIRECFSRASLTN
jgi:hypothetical protein